MSSQISANLVSTPETTMFKNENRNLANFVPSFWDDIFLSYPSEMDLDRTSALEHEELKQEVRRMLVITSTDKPSQSLHLIDAVQRLGVAYHFENEIKNVIQNIFEDGCNDNESNDLYTTAVRFRLLREHGFNVHCDLFKKFKDEKGEFKASLMSDVRGLLELYEAAYFGFHGEDILEEAICFTTSHLKSAETTVPYPLSTQIANALSRPLRKSLPRLVARSYISIYEGYGSQDETLMKFAKLDFNIVQNVHKKEINVICRWWKGIDIKNNFPFIRDRFAESYFWALGVYFEPRYTIARTFMAKVTSMITILDDIYDAYATHEELGIFTEAIHRWDINCLDQLPDYMKLCCSVLFNVYKEVEELMIEQGKQYRVQLAKEAMKQLCQAYYDESKWLQENRIPTLEEYMSIALKTAAYDMLAITAYVGMEDNITKDTFIWAANVPKIVGASNIVCRLKNDIVSHKFEQKRGHIPSAIECYVKQYGTSEEEACKEFNKQINDAWKDINEGFLKPTAVPEQALDRTLNLTRVIHLMYEDELDAFTISGEAAKTSITSLLIDPIPIIGKIM